MPRSKTRRTTLESATGVLPPETYDGDAKTLGEEARGLGCHYG